MHIFLHLPKTGGLTLHKMLAHKFPGNQFKVFHTKQYSPEELESHKTFVKMMENPLLRAMYYKWHSKYRRLQKIIADPETRCIRGHFDLSIMPFFPKDTTMITLMRDPLARIVSHYYYYQRNEEPDQRLRALALSTSLLDWVTRSNLTEMDNGMTRRISGDLNLPCGKLTSATLEKAKENLSRFAVVGLTERFEESQILIHRAIDLPYTRYTSANVRNSAERRTEIPAGTLDLVREYNHYDIELYAYAQQLLEQSLARLDMPAELEKLRNAPLLTS